MIRMAWYGWVAEVGRWPSGEAAEGNGWERWDWEIKREKHGKR